ncbi:MAG: hypothetical protein ABIJ48_03015 [Actinomycetota bacterium]
MARSSTIVARVLKTRAESMPRTAATASPQVPSGSSTARHLSGG